MGKLQHVREKQIFILHSRALIGRHSGCEIQHSDKRTSGEHASLRFRDGSWHISDLASRNGTFVDGRRLSPGQAEEISEGCVIGIGEPQTYTLTDDAAPRASALNLASGERVWEQGEMVVLPDEDAPQVTVYEVTGKWQAELPDGVRPVTHREVLVLDGVRWRLELPEIVEATLEATARPSLETITLCFAVSRDEEHIELTVRHPGGEQQLRPRGYHYMLLTLARLREQDAGASADECGWIDRDQLCRMLACDLNKLNVEIHRARKQLADGGVMGSAGLIERRATAGQLRLGVSRFTIRAL